jgi:hypothetical protein
MRLAGDFLGRACAHALTELHTRPLTFEAAGLLVEFRHTFQLVDPHNQRF